MQQWTSAAEELEALHRATGAAGCTVRYASERETPHGRRAVASVVCPDGWAAGRLLLASALEDSRTSAARDLALQIWSGCENDRDYVQAVWRYVRDHVRFVREEGEVFARSDYTIAAGAGDCDDHARVVFALLRAGGIPARLAFLFKKGDPGPRHVVAQAGLKGIGWVWLETTVDARIGEHPYAAAQRLGILKSRGDIATEVRFMTEKDLQPVPPGFASHSTPAQLEADVRALKKLGFLCDAAAPPSTADEEFRRAVLAFQETLGPVLSHDANIGTLTRGQLYPMAGLVGNQFTHADAREALRQAYVNVHGKEPTAGELDFGLATAFFETFYGRGTAAQWGDGGQFGKWASEGKLNWGALQSGTASEDESTFRHFVAMGLHPTKEQGRDAGRPVFFYLFPSDLEAATAFLTSWGQPDTLAAAATGSATAVSAAMKRHGYYEGFHVAPGKMGGKKSPPFIQEESAEEAERKNVADYAGALTTHVHSVRGGGGVPDPFPFPGPISAAGGVLAVLLVGGAIALGWHLGGA